MEQALLKITRSYRQIQPFIQKELVNPTFLNEEATGLRSPESKIYCANFR